MAKLSRQRMQLGNKKLRQYLVDIGIPTKQIYIKNHGKQSRDIFDIYDGCYLCQGATIFFQIKHREQKPSETEINNFVKKSRELGLMGCDAYYYWFKLGSVSPASVLNIADAKE